MASEGSCRARALAAAIEPFVGSVYFAPEAHAAYAALGFDASPGPSRDSWGAAHVAAFVDAGFDGAGIQVLTERVAGMPPRTYARTRGWDDGALAAAESALRTRGLLAADGTATPLGHAAREEVEAATDRLAAAPADALGDDLVPLVARLQDWSTTLRAGAAYYPSSPQEAVMVDDVQRWMTTAGLARFDGVPAR